MTMISSTPMSSQQATQSSAGASQSSTRSAYRHGAAVSSTPLTPLTPAPVSSVLGSRRRKSEDNAEDGGLSPSKRRKSVHFDMDRNIVIETGVRSLEETKREVRKALESHARGDSELYRELEDLFANERKRYLPPIAGEEDDTLKPHELVVYVIALTAYAPLLNRSCSSLISTVLKCSYLGRDRAFFKAFCQLMAELVSAHGSCMMPVLSTMVDKFAVTSPSSWGVPDFPDVDLETVQERLHSGLQFMLQLFPKAARSVLSHLIAKSFPYPDSSKRAHVAYIGNLLRIRDYAPDMGPEIMALITSRLVKLDSDMQLDLDDMDDDLVAKVVFQLDSAPAQEDDDADSDAESVMSDDQTDFDAEATRIEKAVGLVQKLDAILDLLFGLYAPVFDKPESSQALSTLQQMLTEFTNFVLPTQSCRHTQFLLFHYSQKSHVLMDVFVGTLFNLAFESNRQPALRQAAAAFLGSFVARGAHVPRDTVRTITDVLCRQIEAYRLRRQDDCRGPDLRRHQQLYCWFQALVYIFCFRWKDLVDSPPDTVDPDDSSSYLGHQLEWMPRFRQTLSSAIHSPFNPLKVCSPPIMLEFAKLAQHLQLLYLYPKIEANKNIHLSQFVTQAYSTGGALREAGHDIHDETRLQLESAFPFDPYGLPVSRRWLEGDYLAWKPMPGLDGDEDSDDSDEDAEQGDGEDLEEDDTTTDDDGADD